MNDSKEEQKKALERAKEAATKKDVRTFLQGINDSRLLDGAKRTLEAKYEGALDHERIHEIISLATDKFYEAASGGRKIIFPAAYLWKTIRTTAYDIHKRASKNIPLEFIHKGDIIIEPLSGQDDVSEESRKRRQNGLRIARELLPKIGSDNVQNVMRYIIDAVEAGVEDISSKEIAEALGQSESSVRKWKQRGFERLERAAIEAGYRTEFLREVSSENDINEQENEEE
jgi:DNA-directed RNA polymerase specialized sigma24 family protein